MFDGTIKLWDLNLPIRARHACSPYMFTRRAKRLRGRPQGFGGYLSRDGREVCEGSMCRLRVVRADTVVNLKHTGWYCDPYHDQTIYGVVARLPKGRGFLAGWSMGEGMATRFDGCVHDDIESAALASDEEARIAAENQREFEETYTQDLDT